MKKEVKIGILVIVCMGLLFWGANYLKGTNILDNNRTYYAVYDRVDGLGISNPVVINGFKVGQVRKISFHADNSGKLLVAFSITEDQITIPNNTSARIISSDILGSKSVSLILGDSPVEAMDGDTLGSEIESSLTESVNQQIAPLKKKAEDLISTVDSAIVVVSQIFNKKARGDLDASFTSLRTSLQAFENTMKRAESIVAQEQDHISQIFAHIESITKNLSSNNEALTATIQNIESISDSLAGANLTQTVNNASYAMKQVAEVMDKINNGDGSLGQLLNNDTLYTNLEAASNDLDLLLLDMRMNPERYVHFSIFGRRDKSKKKSKN